MNKDFEKINFRIELTDDLSPTLRIGGEGESMHHSGGAASETQYIYKSVIDEAYQIKQGLKTCVIGLGLAYIELSWALNPHAQPGQLTSFEKIEDLRNLFLNWINTDENMIYNDISKFMAQAQEFDLNQLKTKLKDNYNIQKIQEDLLGFKEQQKWNVICYDAFSSKTNQELWSETFLDNFINRHTEEDCVFTTYACTGVLKRVLLKNNFKVIKRIGFQGKRDATLALRGVFKDSFRIE